MVRFFIDDEKHKFYPQTIQKSLQLHSVQMLFNSTCGLQTCQIFSTNETALVLIIIITGFIEPLRQS